MFRIILLCVCGLVATFLGVIYFQFISEILISGGSALNLSFLIDSPKDFGRSGGIFPIVVSTLFLMILTLLFVIPLGVFTALSIELYSVSNSNFSRLLNTVLSILLGLPSIVYGLVGSVIFCQYLGLGISILSGALTLSLMCLPYFVKILLLHLKGKTRSLYKVSSSLGISRRGFLYMVLLPVTLREIKLPISLSLSRAMAETAALLFTSGYSISTPTSIFDSARTMSVHVFDLSMNVAGANKQAYSTSAILLLIFLIFNYVIKIIGRQVEREYVTS